MADDTTTGDSNLPHDDAAARSFLKKTTEALVKDVGFVRACELTGKSKATLGRYFSNSPEHAERFMPVDVVAALEGAASFPHVTKALADLRAIVFDYDGERTHRDGRVNEDVVLLSNRFARLMEEYHTSITDNVISLNEAKRMLTETQRLQHVLMEMKLHLEKEAKF